MKLKKDLMNKSSSLFKWRFIAKLSLKNKLSFVVKASKKLIR